MSIRPLQREGRGGGPASRSEAAGRAPDEDPLDEIRLPALRAAARRVAQAAHAQATDALHRRQLTAELGTLARAVELGPEESARLTADLADSPLAAGLLEQLRAEVVEQWQRGPSPADGDAVLSLLGGFERVRKALQPGGWPDPVSSPLAGPDGLGLLVEVAHDLRSPLTSILFLAETLRRGQSGEVNDVQRRQLGIIYSAALGLISVASDVIELAHGGDRLSDQDPSPFSVTELFESVRDMVQPMAEEKGLAVRLLPPTTDQRLGYPVALSRVLLNLTTNALKFTDEGFVEIVARAKRPPRLEFSVRDTGNGIDPDVLQSLYSPFRRARGRRGVSFSGSGLGLAICRRLVDAMGGELKVETRPGWGTRFFFDIRVPSAPQP